MPEKVISNVFIRNPSAMYLIRFAPTIMPQASNFHTVLVYVLLCHIVLVMSHTVLVILLVQKEFYSVTI